VTAGKIPDAWVFGHGKQAVMVKNDRWHTHGAAEQFTIALGTVRQLTKKKRVQAYGCFE
jgi:hypothetical protein